MVSKDIAELLIAHGAEIDSRDNHGSILFIRLYVLKERQ